MKLGHRRIIVLAAGVQVELRPSLRYALKLAERPGGLGQIVREINEGSLATAVEIVADHTDMPFLQNRVFDVLPDLQKPLLEYVLACAGIDLENTPAAEKRGSPTSTVSIADNLLNLYKIGTGWLGWTPETTLDATPREIMLAYHGRTEMLRAIFGGSDGKPATDDRPLDQKFRSIFAGHQIVREEA